MNFLIFGGLAYILGSIPTAVWVGKSWFGLDIREHGSKNAGATNTFRVLGKRAGITVLLIDVLKGVLAVILPILLWKYFFTDAELIGDKVMHVQLVAAICVVLGHVFPIFAGFRGGKGVATSLGVIIGLQPEVAGICLLLFLIIFLTTHYVSLGAICAAIAFPLVLIFGFKENDFWMMIFSVLLGGAVISAHRKNIGRLLRGEENKMKLVKK